MVLFNHIWLKVEFLENTQLSFAVQKYSARRIAVNYYVFMTFFALAKCLLQVGEEKGVGSPGRIRTRTFRLTAGAAKL